MVGALRRLGHEAEMWEFGPDNFGYKPDRTIELKTKDPLIFWETFSEAAERFDVIHFHAGRSFFPGEWGGVPAYWDLPILRALGKKVFHTFHGSECRIRRIHMENNPWSYYKYSDIISDEDRTQKIIQIFRTYCNKMFLASPDYLMFVPDAVVIGRMIELSEWPEQAPDQRAIPKILHVPSLRGKKGTEWVVDGLRQLESEGMKFEFSLLEGVPHTEARRAIQDADIVVDNLITGDYELVSIEAMASSRVAVANIQEYSRNAYPDAPVWDVNPDTFVEQMRALIPDVNLRRDFAARGRDHVARTHDVDVVVQKMLHFYELPDTAVRQRTFPDWASIAYTRKIETLEKRVADLELDLARARVRARVLKGRVAEAPPSLLKRLVPEPIRLRLRRIKAGAKRRVPVGIRRRVIERRDRRFQERVRSQSQAERPK
jgi:glycosyltransferase involved in cell wall biosynthesis